MQPQLETYSGKLINLLEPTPDDIRLEDIAHALSLTCRFGGHTSRFYSVAEHALYVSRLVQEEGRDDLALAALHHDSHEAYLGDIPTPLKLIFGDSLKALADRFDQAIGAALGIDPANFHHPEIIKADRYALRIEASLLKRSGGNGDGWPWTDQEPADPTKPKPEQHVTPPEAVAERFYTQTERLR